MTSNAGKADRSAVNRVLSVSILADNSFISSLQFDDFMLVSKE